MGLPSLHKAAQRTLLVLLAISAIALACRTWFGPLTFPVHMNSPLNAEGCFELAAAYYFLSDDFVLLRHAKEFRCDSRAVFATGGGDGFFRPLGYIAAGLT